MAHGSEFESWRSLLLRMAASLCTMALHPTPALMALYGVEVVDAGKVASQVVRLSGMNLLP